MQPIPVYSISLGCPKNRVDTEHLLACFDKPFIPVSTPDTARVVIINTCGFIEPAITESIDTILDITGHCKQQTPAPLVVVTGCLVNRYPQELAQQIPEVDLWFTSQENTHIASHIARLLKVPARPDADSVPAIPELRTLSTGPSYAYLKLAEGCNHSCSFCTIPAIRGPLVSRDTDSLVREARLLLEQGVRELVLVAQDLTAYGQDRKEPRALLTLLEKLLLLSPAPVWIRLMYLYPAGLTQALLTFIKQAGPVLLPYFDIPLQHAHQAILRSMGRPFSNDPYRIIEKVRSILPDAAIRTSLITGYPGETQTHFDTLLHFIRTARFHHLGVFEYCDEEGTRAHTLTEKIPHTVISQRRTILMETQAVISAEILQAYQDTRQQVLVDCPHPEWPGLYKGRIWCQAPQADGLTYISGPAVKPAALITATIEETQTYDLVALA